MINGELVIEWKKEKSIQCEDFDEDTGEKEYTMLWKLEIITQPSTSFSK